MHVANVALNWRLDHERVLDLAASIACAIDRRDLGVVVRVLPSPRANWLKIIVIPASRLDADTQADLVVVLLDVFAEHEHDGMVWLGWTEQFLALRPPVGASS